MATSTPTTVTSSVSYTLLDGEDNLVLTGVDDINGTGNSLNNHITGNVGANILDGAVGADTLEGGAGDDIYVVDDGNDVVVEGIDNGVDSINSRISYTLPDNVENLILLGADSLSGGGNELNNVISGSGGGDFLSGYAGDDTLGWMAMIMLTVVVVMTF